MPVLSGIESTREIRNLESALPHLHPRAYIIALTGLAAQSDRRDAFSAGVDAFMVKPVNFRELQKMLDVNWKAKLDSRIGEPVASKNLLKTVDEVIGEDARDGEEARRGSVAVN